MLQADLLALIRTSVRSVWALELLLLMRRQPDRAWAAPDLVKELRANASLVQDNLALLFAGGLIREEAGHYAYGPASPVLDQAAAALERAYRERPVSVVNLIVGASSNNVQGFADAFRFKREED